MDKEKQFEKIKMTTKEYFDNHFKAQKKRLKTILLTEIAILILVLLAVFFINTIGWVIAFVVWLYALVQIKTNTMIDFKVEKLKYQYETTTITLELDRMKEKLEENKEN